MDGEVDGVEFPINVIVMAIGHTRDFALNQVVGEDVRVQAGKKKAALEGVVCNIKYLCISRDSNKIFLKLIFYSLNNH